MIICDERTEHLWPKGGSIRVPAAHPEFAWILSTAAGHLFSYHAARAIDAEADPLRGRSRPWSCRRQWTGRAVPAGIERACRTCTRSSPTPPRARCAGCCPATPRCALSDAALLLRHRRFDGHRADRVAADPIDFTRARITGAVDELTRPIDSVKHQAKTVTVGTSRGDSDLVDNPLTRAIAEVGADPST